MSERSTNAPKVTNTDEAFAPEHEDPVILAMLEALATVPDPCCVLSGKKLSIMDLGLVNRVERQGETVIVGVTLTDTMCEFSFKIFSDIESLADVVPNVAKVTVVPEVIPIWSPDRLSDKAVAMIRYDAGRFFKHWDLETSKGGSGEGSHS